MDAKKKIPPAARAAGVEVGVIAWGLLELWEHVFVTKETTVPKIILDGCFGAAPRIAEALVAFGFLEVDGEGYRVKGAVEKLLGVREAQSGAGKAKAANLKQHRLPPANPVVLSDESPAHLPAKPVAPPPALDRLLHPTPNTKHQIPLKEEEPETAAPPPPKPKEPPDKFADGAAFFAWVQTKRIEVGLATEMPPHPRQFSKFWTEAGMELNGHYERLEAALYRYADDKFWQQKTPPVPFGGFMAQWRNYVPQANRV
ncbi:MAG TPA: hypothetical protein VFJ52_00510 [Terriglobia bacterium]|nr:hypothetical protein [Terriglobia bacterium]